MASIRQIADDRWQVMWREPLRDEYGQAIKGRYTQRAESFSEETQAHVRKRAIEDAQAVGIDPATQRNLASRTLGAYAADFFDSLPGTGIDPETIDKYRKIYAAYIATPLGSKPVAAIRVADVKKLRSDLASQISKRTKRPLSVATIKHALRVLRSILDTAVENEAIASNPAAVKLSSAAIKRTREHSDSRTYTRLGVQDIAAVVAYIEKDKQNPVYALAILFSAYTGIRRAELQGLEIQDLTLPAIPGTSGAVRVQRNKKLEHGYRSEPLKTANAYRVIPLDGWLADDLRDHLANIHQDATNLKAPLFPGRLSRQAGKNLGRRVTDSADMFDWSRPLDETMVYKRYWLPALKALGFPHSRWHDLRHTFATDAITNGENIRDVSRWLGHSKISTTLDIYANVLAGEDTAKTAPTTRPVATPRKKTDTTNVVPLERRNA